MAAAAVAVVSVFVVSAGLAVSQCGGGEPPDGTHVQVTGTYTLDKNHGWMEIHPISVLRVTP